MITVSELTKVFPDRRKGVFRAVDGISFQVEAGTICGLLGCNGAGKTTTLRMLGTLLQPTSGQAAVQGHDLVREPDQVRAHLGYLSTATALYGRLTGAEVLRFFGKAHGLPADRVEHRIHELCKALDMNDFLHKRCEKLSTGMKQRISIARTVLHEPPVIILDEPTTGLDILAARSIHQFIRQCREEGRTVLFSCHNMGEVERLCDRVLVMEGGRMVAEGTLRELRERTGMEDVEELFAHLIQSPSPTPES